MRILHPAALPLRPEGDLRGQIDIPAAVQREVDYRVMHEVTDSGRVRNGLISDLVS